MKNFKKIVPKVEESKDVKKEAKKSSVPEDFKIVGYKVRKTPTISDVIIVEGLKGAKDREELSQNVFNRLKDLGITKTFRGEITPKSVLNKVNANLRAFKNFKYKNFSLAEEDEDLKLVNENTI